MGRAAIGNHVLLLSNKAKRVSGMWRERCSMAVAVASGSTLWGGEKLACRPTPPVSWTSKLMNSRLWAAKSITDINSGASYITSTTVHSVTVSNGPVGHDLFCDDAISPETYL